VGLALNLIATIVFVSVQWRIAVELLRGAARLFSGWALTAARGTVFLFDAVLLAGYSFSFSELVPRLGIPGHIALIMGAGILAYLIAATAVLAVYLAFKAIAKRLGDEFNPGRRRALNAAGNVLMAAPFVVMGYGAMVERLGFRVRELDVPLPGLPLDLDGLRILQISDIHLSAFLHESDLARVIDMTLDLRPHVAVVTGDLISSRGDPLDACIRQLARVKSDAGTFGCMGNHERYAGVERYAAEAGARAGIRFLRGEAQTLRFGNSVLNLAGVDYQSLADRGHYLRGAERLVVPGAANVLLSHNPDVFPVAARQGYNLLLAGHTHGGQVTVEILDQSINPARFFTPYVYGLFRAGRSAAYVTRGIGTIGIPARIGAPPEISVLRLRKV
jgi:predicted MPP superfamily phosphohydrolase